MKNKILQVSLFSSILLIGGCSGEYRQVVEDLVQKISSGPQLYLRGGFNNWSESTPFTHVTGDIWQANIAVGLGTHEYKIATDDWQTQLMIKDRESAIVDIAKNQSKDYSLAANQTESADILWVEKAGKYQFLLDNSDEENPIVTITRMADLDLKSVLKHNPNTVKKLNFSTHNKDIYQVKFSFYNLDNGLKTYVHSSEQPLRDPVPQISTYSEDERFPYLRTGNVSFDGLFALAIDEMKLDSVEEIRDGAYNLGEPIDCNCFKTGEKWDYVWTRDLSYAANLSLAMLDPQRVKNSLDFKLSGYRNEIEKPKFAQGDEQGIQIIQDTGSGGSWPISTDRVTWALGAKSVLDNLQGEDRAEFALKTLNALSNTLDIDRQVIFDSTTGLYNGEQSFLDWREQTYADWIKNDLSAMATSKSVSTNLAHFIALTLASDLAKEFNNKKRYKKYSIWAADLKNSINEHLWLKDSGMYSSLTASHFDDVAMKKYDWLGQSLAIISGVASSEQIDSILANYPHGPMGAPVIFPQQSGVRVYHNRSIWPFVTAYGLKAAIKGENVSVVNAAYATLIRSAALNISNMENLEWLSGQSIWLERADSKLSGPVINSKSQLWSVGGYLNMVIEGVFGLHVQGDKLFINPFLTTKLKQRLFNRQEQIRLNNVSIHGKKINVVMTLPKRIARQGVYTIKRIMLNQNSILGQTIHIDQLNEQENEIRIDLADVVTGKTAINKLTSKPGPHDESVYAPYEAELKLATKDSIIRIEIIDEKNIDNVVYNIYRNGQLVANDINAKSWLDLSPATHQACYSVNVKFSSSKNYSHHSPVVCTQPGDFISADDQRIRSLSSSVEQIDETSLFKDWGDIHDVLSIEQINIDAAGDYAFQIKYRNLFNNTNTGITAGVKWFSLIDENQKTVKTGVIQMPHTKASNGAAFSTPISANLMPGKYRVEISDFFNMSYLTNNQTYSQSGGQSGPLNHFDFYGLRVMPTEN